MISIAIFNSDFIGIGYLNVTILNYVCTTIICIIRCMIDWCFCIIQCSICIVKCFWRRCNTICCSWCNILCTIIGVCISYFHMPIKFSSSSTICFISIRMHNRSLCCNICLVLGNYSIELIEPCFQCTSCSCRREIV